MLSREIQLIAVIAAGGVLGACARFGASQLWPGTWTTLWVNVTGCAAMGVLLVFTGENGLARPFLGTGVLGGYTTFSTYVVDAQRFLHDGRAALALFYLTATLAAALLATWAAAALTRLAVRR